MPLAGTDTRARREAVLWFVIAASIYWLASHHLPIEQKHYVYMADAFLHGSLSVANPPVPLVELVQSNGGNYFGYGVMPAVVLMPFVALWGRGFDPAIAGILFGAANVLLVNRILARLQVAAAARHWLTMLLAFGTVHFLESLWGTTWFFMQIIAFFFLSLSIYLFLAKHSAVWIGLCFGAAVLSRNAILVAAPFFVFLYWQSARPWAASLRFAAALAAMMLANASYNYLRFGNPFETGYAIAFNGPYGLFNLHYLAHNLYTYFLKPPDWLGRFPYFSPSLDGMSLWLTTPAWLLLLPTLRQLTSDRLVLASWLATAAVGGLYLLYFWSGFMQFGVRYTLDYTPFLMLLLAIACRDGVRPPAKWLIGLSIAVNCWGVAWWRLHYVSTLSA